MGGIVYVEGGGVYFWNAASDAWSTIDTSVPMGDYHNFAEHNPVHGLVLLGGGNDSGVVHVLDADGNVTPAEEAPFPLLVNRANVTVDPLSGDFIVLGGGDEMWVYDAIADEWSLQPGALPASLTAGDGLGDLMISGPIDSHGVILVVKHIGIGDSGEAEVWLYKHSPGMGVGRPDGGVPPPSDGGVGSGGDGGGVVLPSDGGMSGGDGSTGGPPPMTDDGCGCRVAARRASGGAWLVACAMLLLGAPRARRSRQRRPETR
jgi:hypothetical protein